ncbi:helix-turn-helix domain-containing protein [Enterococcus gallinarum]|uniref:helix-turn-helix domain-containing protein n=2 Tax=Enterococcus gallinarum TaxID=1353 RepID=UPI001F05BE81|nr:helix-turn-helix domain-containing protein [Enterococcus gallinarum]
MAETNEVINVEDMAKKLGRSVAAVSKKIYELRRDGVLPKIKRELAFDSKGRPWTAEEEKRLIAMYKQGCSYVDIAEALGRSESSCSTKASKLQSIGKIKSKRLAHWTDQEVALILDKVEFDANGYVSNYSELARVTGKQYSQVLQKVNRLRKEGKITTNVKPGTTSVKSKQSMQKFNAARFAQYAKKEEDSMQTGQPMQSRSVTAGSLSIESKEERVIHTVVIFAGLETHTYFSADGTKIAEIQKEPTPVPASVSQTVNN